MGEQIQAIKNALIKEKFKIDFRLMPKDKIILFKWNQFIKSLTHLFYFTIISLLFGFGWKYLLELNSTNVITNINEKTVLIGYGIGHTVTQLLQLIIGYHGKLKFNHKVLDEYGNPQLKKPWTNKLFLLLSLIPLLIWFIGYISIKIYFKKKDR